MEIIPRSGWAHRPPRSTPVRIPDRLPRRWLHHGAGGSSSIATARAYLNHHLDGNGWADIGYSWLIAEGKVLEGRGVGRQGAHTRGDNDGSYGVVVCGNYSTRAPADRDLDALVWLLHHGHAEGWFTAPEFTGGHRDAPGASTTCPGSALWTQIGPINRRAGAEPSTGEAMFVRHGDEGEAVQYIQMLLADVGHPPEGGADGDFGDNTADAISAYWRDRHGSDYHGREVTAHVLRALHADAFGGQAAAVSGLSDSDRSYLATFVAEGRKREAQPPALWHALDWLRSTREHFSRYS